MTTDLQGEERAKLLYGWNDTGKARPDVCVHQLFENQVEQSPDAVAIVFGERRLTYRELNRRANQVAHFLREAGIGPDKLVGVSLERCPELVVGLLAVWKAGGAYVPLDPAYPRERLSFMVSDASIGLLLTERKCRDLFSSTGATTVCLDDDWATFAQGPAGNLEPLAVPSNLAYVMYTSGSTGQPKGAMILHGGLVNYLLWAIEAYAVEAGGSVPVHSSIAFDLTVTSLYPALLSGGQVELLTEDVGAQHVVAALRRTKDRNLVKITPAHLDVLTQQLRPEELAGLTRAFIIGGENLPAESLSPWRDRAPATRLINEYGPTETVVGCCIYEVKRDDPRHGPVPIGRPIDNTQLYVLDEELQPVPLGAMGELFIGGAGVARGYLNRPELTKERFLADPFSRRIGERMYRTGDLARYRLDGTLEFLGRVDNQVKIRGYRIELGEIEAILASHPSVQSCAVLAREDTPGNKQLVGYVVTRDGGQLRADELHGFLTRQLPEYMAPGHFVFLDAMPLTPNGKVDRKALPAPSAASALAAPEFAPPKTETEKSIAAIWAELLQVDAVAVDADFFDLGGHSLLAIKALAQVRDLLGVDLPPQTLFEHSTLRALAAIVQQARGTPDDVHGIPALAGGGPFTASFGQQQLWMHDQLVPDSPAYNLVDVLSFSAPFDARALRRALTELVSRHETLRTTFSTVDGQLMQNVSAPFEPEIPEIDLGSRPEAERHREWSRLVREQGRRPFDLSQLPLFRATLVHASPTEHRLLLTIHHIVADEWSMDLIHEEVNELYSAFTAGRPSTLEPLGIQYAAFAAWQRERLNSALLSRQIAFWKEALKGALSGLALPVDKPRPPVPTLGGTLEVFTLPKELLDRLQSLGRHEQATLFMVLEAAFAALMRRHTGQDDVLVGTPISCRTHTEAQRMIGYFLNTIVLRSQFNGDPSFRSLLHEMRDKALGGYAHADIPFDRLVAEIAPLREPGRTPLFQVMFVLHNKGGLSRVSKLSESRELETGSSKFELTLYMSEATDGLEGAMEYSTDLFEAETVRRLCRSYAQLLDAVVRDPDEKLSRLPMPDEELTRLRQFNSTATEYPRHATIARLFEQQASATPESPAVRSGAASLTYRALDERANQLARALRRRSVGRGSIVGVSLTRSIDMVAAMLAVMKAGGAYLPLDPAFPPARLKFMVEDSALSLVVSESEHADRHGAPPDMTFELDRASEELSRESSAPLPYDQRSARPEDPAYVLYTSGSTGKPKGVVVHHRAAVNVLTSFAREPGCGAHDRWLAVTTLSFDIALLELILPLVVGGEVVLASRDEALDGDALQRLLGDHAITIMQATPATWRLLVDSGWAGTAGLKALCGGEALPIDLAGALLGRVGQLWNVYGPTETTVWSTCSRVSEPGPGITVGRPIANTAVWILDAQLRPCPIGVPGEIYIGGDGVAVGYLNRPELTKERFIPDPFGWAPGSRLYKTGDLGRLRQDGRIECLGRTDFQVKVRGFRIELGEIEARLAEHPAVRETCVMVHESAPGDAGITAYFAPRPGQTVTSTDLRAHLRGALPDYMIPNAFVELPELPRTQNGKVDRNALPAPFATGPTADEAIVPTTEAELLVADVWKDLLGRSVGAHENFFEAGGHSLLVVRAIGTLAKRTGVRLSPRVFVLDTLAQIAAQIESGQRRDGAKQDGPPPAAPAKAPEPESLLSRLKNRLLG